MSPKWNAARLEQLLPQATGGAPAPDPEFPEYIGRYTEGALPAAPSALAFALLDRSLESKGDMLLASGKNSSDAWVWLPTGIQWP